MIVRKQVGGQTQRSSLAAKENISAFTAHDKEIITITLRTHEKMLADIQKQLRQKVNKSDFAAGLSSKLSISQITNLTMDLSNEESKLNISNASHLHTLQDQVNAKVRQAAQKMEKIKKETEEKQMIIRQELKTMVQQIEGKIQKLEKSVAQGNRGILEMLEKKSERSEFDKVMHLANLLAIEFELIKKRFSTFESDSSLVWKQISHIYEVQEAFKQQFQAQKQQRQNEANQGKTHRNSKMKNGLLFTLKGSAEDASNDCEIVLEEQVPKLLKEVETLKRNEEDHAYSLRLLGERVSVVENYHESWFKSLKQIEKMKKQTKDAKEDVENLYTTHQKFKEQCVNDIKQKVKQEVNKHTGPIKTQIQTACEEITVKVLKIFEKAARSEDLLHTNDLIEQLQQLYSDKMKNLESVIKRNADQHRSQIQVQQEKMRALKRQVQSCLKADEFTEQRSQLITNVDAVSLVKKCESILKKELEQFKAQQSELNQVLCSQNVLMRWVWTSGRLRGGNLVAWDHQTVNTLPENFIYCPEEYCFKVLSGGIYRFELGFYAKKKPTIQIIINGQTIVSAVNSNSYVVHHSSGKLKDINANQVSGLTYYDFFTLQENSRIAIAYAGDLGHGFIGIQRM